MAEQTAESFPELDDLDTGSGSADAEESEPAAEAPADATVVMPKQPAASDRPPPPEDTAVRTDENEPARAGSAS